jgi:hypothetical protein
MSVIVFLQILGKRSGTVNKKRFINSKTASAAAVRCRANAAHSRFIHCKKAKFGRRVINCWNLELFTPTK